MLQVPSRLFSDGRILKALLVGVAMASCSNSQDNILTGLFPQRRELLFGTFVDGEFTMSVRQPVSVWSRSTPRNMHGMVVFSFVPR